MRRTLLVGMALLLAAPALLVPAPALVQWLNPVTDSARFALQVQGARWLEILFCIDAVLLLLLAVPAGPQRTGTAGLWQPHPEADPSWQRHAGWLTVLILLLAVLLRVLFLNNDLWIDEVFTLVNFVRLPAGALVMDFTDDNQHLFFSLLSHYSVSLFGESHWAVRLPAVLFGVGSIWAVMRLARRVFGTRAALLSGLLLSLSWQHVWFSQNARGYTILLFGTLLATDLLLRALQYGRWRDWIAYALVIAFTAWAHVTAVFVALGHALVVLVRLLAGGGLSRAAAHALAGFLLSAWFTVHLYALVLPQMLEFFSRPGGGTGVTPVEWRHPLWLFNEIFQRLGVPAELGWGGVVAVLVVVAACGIWYLKRWPLFVSLALMPGLLLGAVMFVLGRNLWPRMFFNEAGSVVILLAVGLLALGSWLARRLQRAPDSFTAVAPALLSVLLLAFVLPGVYRYPKQDFTGARDFVLANMQAGDSVVGVHVTGRIYHAYYAPQWPEVSSLDDLARHRSATGHTWVLYTLPGYIHAVMPDLAQELEQHYELVKVFPGTLGDGAIIVRRNVTDANQ